MNLAEYRKLISHSKNRKNKFSAKKTVSNGITFDSKLEADYYDFLCMLKEQGDIENIFYQVPFRFEFNGVKKTLWLDFMVIWSDHVITYVDTKGMETEVWKLKRMIVESQYNIKIDIVNKNDLKNYYRVPEVKLKNPLK